MDNLRPLSRSLPPSVRATSTRTTTTTNGPPEAVLQAFKEAACSVTKLYKEAAASHQRARQAGYQDALDDLLAFLDREDLGLDDGEGWRVRQWATERLDTRPSRAADDEREESDSEREREGSGGAGGGGEQREDADRGAESEARPAKRADDSPPAPQSTRLALSEAPTNTARKRQQQQQQQQRPASPLESANKAYAGLGTVVTPAQLGSPQQQQQQQFTFRAAAPAGLMDTDENESAPAQAPAAAPLPSVRRRKQHSGAGVGRWSATPASATGARDRLGLVGAGAKRKFAMGDYFDLSDVGVKDWWTLRDGKDGSGSGGGAGTAGGGGGGREAKKNRLA